MLNSKDFFVSLQILNLFQRGANFILQIFAHLKIDSKSQNDFI
jgi:hypothetical protein